MSEQRTSGTATVMFTDVESSTDITTRLGDDAAASLLATHNTIVLDQVAAFGGRDVRSTGDGFLVVFDSARAAVSCALAIQRELTEREHPIRVRIGLNAGEVLHSGDELFGAAINLAARVMDRADGGETSPWRAPSPITRARPPRAEAAPSSPRGHRSGRRRTAPTAWCGSTTAR